MQIKLERRQPVSFYRWQEKRRLWERIPVAAIAKYAALTLVGVLLFRAGQARVPVSYTHLTLPTMLYV